MYTQALQIQPGTLKSQGPTWGNACFPFFQEAGQENDFWYTFYRTFQFGIPEFTFYWVIQSVILNVRLPLHRVSLRSKYLLCQLEK